MTGIVGWLHNTYQLSAVIIIINSYKSMYIGRGKVLVIKRKKSERNENLID